jgi:hypothetical protein
MRTPEVADVVLDRYLAAMAGTVGRGADASATAAGPAPAQARA